MRLSEARKSMEKTRADLEAQREKVRRCRPQSRQDQVKPRKPHVAEGVAGLRDHWLPTGRWSQESDRLDRVSARAERREERRPERQSAKGMGVKLAAGDAVQLLGVFP